MTVPFPRKKSTHCSKAPADLGGFGPHRRRRECSLRSGQAAASTAHGEVSKLPGFESVDARSVNRYRMHPTGARGDRPRELSRARPEELVEIRLDLQDGIQTASISSCLDPDTAVTIAGLMMGQDDVELNEAAVSALQESLSQFFGPASTALGDRTGCTVMTEAPEGQFVPKAMIGLPEGEFRGSDLSLDDRRSGDPPQLKEVFALRTVQEILWLSGRSVRSLRTRPRDAPHRHGRQQSSAAGVSEALSRWARGNAADFRTAVRVQHGR